jgi:cytochrome c-type biogenesis protein CcmH/NrfG
LTASRIDPSNAQWSGLRAAILVEKGDGTGAVEALTQAIARSPSDLEWRLRRAEVELADKTYVAAADDYQTVLKSKPDDRRVVLGLARALIGQDLGPSARVLLDEWMRKHPEDGEAAALRENIKH